MFVPILELSTAHIKPETDRWLRLTFHSLNMLRDPYFTLIQVPVDHTNDLAVPDDLRAIFDFAQSDNFDDGIQFIKLDGDGDVIEGLPVYDWT